jgi:hypothetical protein
MNKRKISLVLAMIGGLASAGAAYVMRAASTGSGIGDHGPADCFYFYIILMILSQFAFVICLSRCSGDDREGVECTFNCFFYNFIIQVVLIIGLLTCLLITGPL